MKNISIKSTVKKIKDYASALELLSNDVPNLKCVNTAPNNQSMGFVFYIDCIEDLDPVIDIKESYFDSLSIYKNYEYLIDRKVYNFLVLQENFERLDLFKDTFQKEYSIEFINVQRELKSIFSKEFIKKITKITDLYFLKVLNDASRKVHKRSYLPKRVKLLMNF